MVTLNAFTEFCFSVKMQPPILADPASDPQRDRGGAFLIWPVQAGPVLC